MGADGSAAAPRFAQAGHLDVVRPGGERGSKPALVLGFTQARHDLLNRLSQDRQLGGDMTGDGLEVQAAVCGEPREQRVDRVRSTFWGGTSVLG